MNKFCTLRFWGRQAFAHAHYKGLQNSEKIVNVHLVARLVVFKPALIPPGRKVPRATKVGESNIHTYKSQRYIWPLWCHFIIAERISARHWIADCGSGIGARQLYHVCMYVRHAFGMQLRLSACAMATLFVPQMIHAYSPACVRASACMHALQLITSTWIIIHPKWGDVHFLVRFSD